MLLQATISTVAQGPDGAIVNATISVPSVLELSEFAQGAVNAYWAQFNSSFYNTTSLAAIEIDKSFLGRGDSQGQFIASSGGYATRSDRDFRSFFKQYFRESFPIVSYCFLGSLCNATCIGCGILRNMRKGTVAMPDCTQWHDGVPATTLYLHLYVGSFMQF